MKKMRYFLLFFVIFSLSSCNSMLFVRKRNIQLYLIRENDKWGYINQKGKVMIKPIYDNCCFSSTDDNCCTQYFSANEYCVVIKDGRYGLIDFKGKELIKPLYNYLEVADDSLLIAKLNNKWGVINLQDNIVIPFIFDTQYHLVGVNVGSGTINEIAYLIDYKTRAIKKTNFTYISPFFKGIASVELNGKQGYINSKGDILIEPIYQEVSAFNKGLAFVKFDNKWGAIDTSSKIVIPFKYENSLGFDFGNSPSLAVVLHEGKYGVVNSSGTYVLKPQYDWIDISSDSLFVVNLKNNEGEDKWGIVNHNNEWVLSNEYEHLECYDGYVNASKNYLHGIIELKSKKIIIPFEYEFIDLFDNDGLTLFQKRDKELGESYYGYFNKQGKVIWKEKNK